MVCKVQWLSEEQCSRKQLAVPRRRATVNFHFRGRLRWVKDVVADKFRGFKFSIWEKTLAFQTKPSYLYINFFMSLMRLLWVTITQRRNTTTKIIGTRRFVSWLFDQRAIYQNPDHSMLVSASTNKSWLIIHIVWTRNIQFRPATGQRTSENEDTIHFLWLQEEIGCSRCDLESFSYPMIPRDLW